jgi:hypothetical protein
MTKLTFEFSKHKLEIDLEAEFLVSSPHNTKISLYFFHIKDCRITGDPSMNIVTFQGYDCFATTRMDPRN